MARKRPQPRSPNPNHLTHAGRDRHLAWSLDYDYAHKLNPADARWLAEFTQEYYRSGSRRRQTVGQIRERWRAYKASQVDLMSGGDGLGKREPSHDGDGGGTSGADLRGSEDQVIATIDRKRRNRK